MLSSLSGLRGLRTELLGLSFPFSACVPVHHSQAVEKGVGSLVEIWPQGKPPGLANGLTRM